MKRILEADYIYNDYKEIPQSTVDYVLSVSDADNIADIPLEDINDFLNGLDKWTDENSPPRTYVPTEEYPIQDIKDLVEKGIQTGLKTTFSEEHLVKWPMP